MNNLIATLIIIINNNKKALEFFKEELLIELNIPNSYLTISKLIKQENYFEKTKFHIDFDEKNHSIKYINDIISKIDYISNQNWEEFGIDTFDYVLIDYRYLSRLAVEVNKNEYNQIYSSSYDTEYNWSLTVIPEIPYSDFEKLNVNITEWVQNEHTININTN